MRLFIAVSVRFARCPLNIQSDLGMRACALCQKCMFIIWRCSAADNFLHIGGAQCAAYGMCASAHFLHTQSHTHTSGCWYGRASLRVVFDMVVVLRVHVAFGDGENGYNKPVYYASIAGTPSQQQPHDHEPRHGHQIPPP